MQLEFGNANRQLAYVRTSYARHESIRMLPHIVLEHLKTNVALRVLLLLSCG